MPKAITFSILLLLSVFGHRAFAQPDDRSDAYDIYRMLDEANERLHKMKYDSAISLTIQAAAIAKQRKNLKAHAWAEAKRTEVLIEMNELKQAEELALYTNKLALQANDSTLAGISLLYLAQAKMYMNEVNEAILVFDKCISAYLGKKPNYHLGVAFNDLGYAWGLESEYERQSQFTLKALGIFEKLNDDGGIAMALGNLSSVYYKMGQKDKAIDFGRRSLLYREKTGDIRGMSINCCNLSQYYLDTDKEQSTRYQELCIKYAMQTGEEERIIHAFITSSLVASKKKDFKTALEYEQHVIGLLEKSRTDLRMLCRRYIAAAFYTDQLNYDTTVTMGYYNKALSYARLNDDKSNLKDVHLYISEYYKRKESYSEAYNHYRKHVLYRDSILNVEKEQKIAELEKVYETNKKDAEIERLNNERKIRQLEIEKQKAIIAGNEAAAREKQNEIDLLSKTQELLDAQLAQQTQELEKQSLESRANAQQLKLSEKESQLRQKQLKNQRNVRNLLLAALVLFLLLGITYLNQFRLKKKLEQQKSLLAMRNSISQDLHDDIGASLSNINILNELVRRNIRQPEKAKEYLGKASEDIQRISESLSDIVWNINPRYDDLQNLFIRMKRYAADMLDGKNISGHFDFPEEVSAIRLGMTQRRDLYLLFKEAVNNLVKYSKAANAVIKVQTENDKLVLTVSDDGVGFDRNTISSGNGLQNMEQRARTSGGNTRISSVPGQGTMVRIEMPLE